LIILGLFNKKNDDGTIKTLVNYTSGLNDMFRENELVDIIWNEKEKKVTFQSRIANRDKVKHIAHLEIDKIKLAKIVSEKDIIEKSKSVGGRAVVGAVLLGPLGALLGGMSGIGNKQKTKKTNYVVFNYNEDEVASFRIPLIGNELINVLKGINSQLNIPTEINL